MSMHCGSDAPSSRCKTGQTDLPGPIIPERFLSIDARMSDGICIETRFAIPMSNRVPDPRP